MSKPKAPRGCYWRERILWGRAKVKGREYRWSLHTDDPKIARARRGRGRDRLIAQVRHGDARRLFIDVCEAWEPHIGRQVSARTLVRYACSLDQLRLFLEALHLDEVDGELVGEIIAGRAEKGATNATIKRDLVALSSVMNFAVAQGWCPANPVLPRMKLLKERRDPIVLPEPADIERVIARAPGLLAELVRAAWRTGCRQAELTTAQRPQLDHGRRQLTITGKGNKVRVIDLDPFDGYAVFQGLPAMIGKAWLFWHGQGEPYRNVSSRFAALCRELADRDKGFTPFRFHDLRHRHAVDWLKSGRSIYDLQQRLGHASIKTTEGYLKYLTPEERRAAMFGEAAARGVAS